ncbi:hormone-sensitive lipase-like isoform X1 [Megalops cyprinoides]|uniref:hormone-sensitive lipase-like isoform X1 n=2 Tax=Megalops cyprinoides TaxID=118141 RepID=UPI001864A109|nr:hormone-sensitive lipase-like isoform X1 [Megalops cyprinoides]
MTERHSTAMDNKGLFTALHNVCDDAIAALSGEPSTLYGESARRLIETMTRVQEHARGLEPIVAGFAASYHHFDFDPQVPANGYRSLVKVVRSCIVYIIQKGHYILNNCHNIFFRAAHNATEMEAYCSALCQLRALLYLAKRLLHDNDQGNLYFQKEGGLSQRFMQEYASLHKACFYGRCLGFQFSPAIRPFLQTVVISLVSFGENYKKHQSLIGMAASSFFTSGKYVVDPELRGAEFERIIQNLDMPFWKSFWNLTETELLSGLASITSNPVRVNRTLSVPPMSFKLPLTSDPNLSVTISPPVAHRGPGPVHMRLISHELREGQESEELLAFSRTEGTPMSLNRGLFSKPSPPSPWLLVHFHGGGFVAQTSKSHENYLKRWSQDLNVPILSVDYSLAPEAPFPRALEECFYAYCWALKHCHLLGSTGERVCLAGDSAGGNLCITVSMRALSYCVRPPDGIMVAYPATLLTTFASPSRLLTLIDPMLPLSVLSKCISAYAGTEPWVGASQEEGGAENTDSTQGVSSWFQSLLDPNKSPTVQRSVSDTALSSSSSDATASGRDPPRSQTCQDLSSDGNKGADTGLSSNKNKHSAAGSSPPSVTPPPASGGNFQQPGLEEYPDGFQPLRSEQLAHLTMHSSPISKNPYVSPLLAPDSMLKGLPPVHIVASALDAMLDDSVMFAKRLRSLNQPVTLSVVEDLPHGFLSLLQLSKETQEASNICMERIREVFAQRGPQSASHGPEPGKTNQNVASPVEGASQEKELPVGGWTRKIEDEELEA